MRSLVEHLPIVIVIEKRQIVEDTGIDAYMYYKKRYQKQTRQRHHQFLSYRRSEELRPFHNYRRAYY